MYLLTFVVVLISILGLYANVAALQAAKIAEKQTVAATLMVEWSGAAYAMVKTAGAAMNDPGTGGCSLTSGFTAVPICTRDAGVPVQLDATTLPPGYNAALYTFNSVYYAPTTTQRFIITFLSPPGGDASLAVDDPALGVPIGEVFRQMRRLDPGLNADTGSSAILDPVSFGYVTTDGGGTPIIYGQAGGGINYPLPDPNIVPIGSLAIVTAP